MIDPPQGYSPLKPGVDVPSLRDMSRAELARAEEIIGRGKVAFEEVATALVDVRDRRGYRFEFGTFDQYCKLKWGWTPRRAQQLMAANEFVGEIQKSEPMVRIETERQARELAEIGKEKVVEQLRPALVSGLPGAVKQAVRSIVREHRQAKKQPPQQMTYAPLDAPESDEAHDRMIKQAAKEAKRPEYHRACPACQSELYAASPIPPFTRIDTTVKE